MKNIAVSIPKFEDGVINEDAAIALDSMVAVSDGAGGGGVYAERWSAYLVNHLPETPIGTFEELDSWIEQIWEPFYNDCEESAKLEGGMLLDKFYDEGSFATLATIWKQDNETYRWISYGDSVVFHYNKTSGKLEHSFTKLADFNEPPYLVNCKDELNPEGFRSGTFKCSEDSIVFAASDTLSHYILMMYEVSKNEYYKEELQEAINFRSKNGTFIKNAMNMKKPDFEKEVLYKLLNCRIWLNMKRHINSLAERGLIGFDDYSFVAFRNKETKNVG